jgi:hypothetical protein
MDIVNWDALKKGLLIKNALENPDDLVLVAANTTYKKRGDLFQTYAIPASSLGGGGETIVLLSDISKSSSSVPSRYEYSDVTGLSFPVVAGRTYIYRFVMYFNVVSTNPVVPATGIGTGWAVNGTNTFSNLRLTALFSGTSTASLTPVPQTSYDEAVATGNTAQATLGGTAIIEGTVTPTSNGIFSARYKTDPTLFAGVTIVVRQGSSVTYSSFA